MEFPPLRQQHCTRWTRIEIQIKTNLQKLIPKLVCSGYKTDVLSDRYFKTFETYLFIFPQRNTNRFLPNSAVMMCVMCLHKCLLACSKQIERLKPVCLSFSFDNFQNRLKSGLGLLPLLFLWQASYLEC